MNGTGYCIFNDNGGRLAHQFKFPMITGYVVIGILLSPSVVNVISDTNIEDLGIFTAIALGIIAYSIGGSLRWESMRKQERSIFVIGVMQAAGGWFLTMLALLIFVGRFGGKYLGTVTGATIARSPESVKKYLGLALMPKAGVTLGLALLALDTFPTSGSLIYNGILASVIINELFAPPLVKYAIFKAGEQSVDSRSS